MGEKGKGWLNSDSTSKFPTLASGNLTIAPRSPSKACTSTSYPPKVDKDLYDNSFKTNSVRNKLSMIPLRTSRTGRRLSAILLLILLGFAYTGLPITSTDAASIGPAQTQATTWISLESDYPEATFRDVEFINSSHGWVVGILYPNITRGGIILHTEDGGDTWETQLADDSQIFRQIEVVNDRTVWVTGLGRLYFTNDSGASWHTSLAGSNRLSTMSTVEFLNETHGWTATMQMLFKTTDGGQTWQNMTGWTFDDNPRDMHFLTEHEVWAIGYDGIYHSDDGAETWEKVFDKGGWSLSFPNEDEAWGVSDGYLLHMEQDHTWEELAVPGRLPSFRLRSPYCSDIQFIDDQHGWIVGDEIPVMHTPNGGSTWYQQSVPTDIGSRRMAVCFVDELHGWVVGYDGCILRTSAGGNLDMLLLSGQEDLLLIVIGTAGIAIALTIGILGLRWRRRRIRATRTGIDSKSTPEIL
ncbi:MAG: hypothetical protein C4K48_12830 [Candidatus Thorarchaeota archaeon]|nr:MAG: hypothetical protein C4K48_12830 [Candidatus Thorarchaeota archaeon]